MMLMRGISFFSKDLAIDELDATIRSQQLVKVSYTTTEMRAKFIVMVLTIQTSIISTFNKMQRCQRRPLCTKTMREWARTELFLRTF